MLVAINGTIIDTKHIYKITPIETDKSGHLHHRFNILLFNDKHLKVEISTNCYGNYNSQHIMINYGNDSAPMIDHNAINGKETIKNSEPYKNSLLKIGNLRFELIKYWSESQSDIPQLNL